ncbi:uncharacterized protein B0H18DRAFT_950524 [Fomitopsis serialis]|uniref:uncharacterized protein n=1 Tax=Fomitopsis serialis TaxID=139415 RepID=UPI002008B857|nr:uncharacterized protein B0H18DRAFT_950524 [Neoantrodia serialis]KAH9936128.1 hypothetical protein B0H18DRAFT_950524 [Neoantrodia serialis]
MSRPSRSSMGPPQNMPPPLEIIMGPPPLPPQASQPRESSSKKAPDPDVPEKYAKLVRKYKELEEKFTESQFQLQRSGERNLKWRAERALLLDRITELETNPQVNPGAPIPGPPFTAFPRSLLSVNSQKHFVSNLRQAIDEVDQEDPNIDPVVLSRHIGPDARKRQEEQRRQQEEDEAREARRQARRPRTTQKGKEMSVPVQQYAPPHPSMQGQGNGVPPVLVSSSGTRLRLKPPAPPSGEASPPPGSSMQPPLPHGLMQGHRRSESPGSPMMSPHDEYPPPVPGAAYSPSFRPAGAEAIANAPPSQSQMQMTLRTSSSGALAASRPTDIQRHAKPKRLKAHTVQSKSFSIPMVPRDKKGRPLLPLVVGIMTVINLGDVCMREHFHTERYIFPIHYEVTRRYLSMVNPDAEAIYHCTILDGGDGPTFQITPQDKPEHKVLAGTATGAWSTIVKEANRIRNRQHSNSNTIKHLIQELPNAHQLKDYVWQHFVEGGPLGGRHAAVIPALPEDNDQAEGGRPDGGPYYSERGKEGDHRELQIIQVDAEDPSRPQPYHPPPSTMKPIQFQQEYQEYVPPHARDAPPQRGRRSSRTSNPAYEDYGPTGNNPVRGESPSSTRMSHSPVMHRERENRERYSPPPQMSAHHTRSQSHSSMPSPRGHHHSPYHPGTSNGEAARHYPTRSGASPPPYHARISCTTDGGQRGTGPPPPEEYAYANGSNGRRNGHASANVQSFPPG